MAFWAGMLRMLTARLVNLLSSILFEHITYTTHVNSWAFSSIHKGLPNSVGIFKLYDSGSSNEICLSLHKHPWNSNIVRLLMHEVLESLLSFGCLNTLEIPGCANFTETREIFCPIFVHEDPGIAISLEGGACNVL